MRLLLSGAVVAGLLLSPGQSWAQDDPVRDLLSAARSRLNDLRYGEADSIAQAVLDFPNLRNAYRIQALQLSAAARFPEQETAQERSSAVAVLRQLIRIAPGAELPREVTWPGLDSLYRQVRKQVFGASARPKQSNILTGPDEHGGIDVIASRPAVFTLGARDTNGQFVRLDSVGPVEKGVLRFSILRDMRQLLRNGPLELTILAIDPEWSDTIRIKYDGVVDAPSFELVSVPSTLDSTRLLREITKPRKVGGIIGGLVVAVGTMVASHALRESAFRDRTGRDTRAVTLGIVLGIGAGAGVWFLDKGAPITKNIEANRDLLKSHNEAIAAAKAENQRRVTNYRGELRINPEPK